jgi:LacI family transcriptional regulator
MKAAGLDPDRALVDITTSAQSAREGEESVEKLLSAPIEPTAVFCANDLLALGLMRGLIKRGVTIPGDMALVGYDDVEFASVLATPLTSIRQPKYELGRTAAELLLDEANNPTSHQHKHIVYQPELIVRESSLK